MKPPRSLTRLYPNVRTCIDAKRPVGVEVRARDVAGAEKGAAADCAMARAICREWKADAAVIGVTFSYVVKGTKAMRFVTPESVGREIVSFDRSADFAPGTYHLAPVSKSRRRGASSGKKSTRGHGPRRRIFHGESPRVRSMRGGGK